MSTSIAFDERLEKHPHPCRQRRHPGSEIGFEERPRRRIFEKLAKLTLDLIALPFTDQEIAQPVKRLDDAHRRSPGPEQLAGRGRTEGDRHVAELDRAATSVGVHHDFGRDGVSQAQIVRCGHAVDKHPCLVASPNGVDDRPRIGWVGFLGELVEARLIVEPAIDPPEGFGLRQPLQRLVDGVSRGEIDEIAGRPDLARRIAHGCGRAWLSSGRASRCSCPKIVALFRTEGQPSVRKYLYKFRTKRAYRARNRAPSGFISSQQYRLNRTLFSWPWEAGRALHRAKVLELSEDHWFGNQVALEALVRFSDEELKHQALFRLCPSSNALRQFATLLSGGSSSSVRLN